MGIMVRERAAQEAGLMEPRRGDYLSCGALQAEPQLPCGWEKCLDLKSRLIYFKDWNSGTLTYKDPRQQAVVPLATQRIGLLSISLSPDFCNVSSDGASKEHRRVTPPHQRFQLAQTATITNVESSATETTTTTMTGSNDEHSLELSLNLPGTTSRALLLPATNSNQDESVCTMDKVRSALQRSNWWASGSCKRSSHNLSDTLPTALSLLSSRPSMLSSRESNSSRLDYYSGARDSITSPSTSSQCSDLESPSTMSYEGDDEEVQQRPRWIPAKSVSTSDASSSSSSSSQEVMVTVGCKSCLLYVMLSKAHPCCPKCGNTDVFLQLPAAPLPKKQRLGASASPTWTWCAA